MGVRDVMAEHERIGFVRGVRGKEVGVPHGRAHQRRAEAEADGGKGGGPRRFFGASRRRGAAQTLPRTSPYW